MNIVEYITAVTQPAYLLIIMRGYLSTFQLSYTG